MTPRGIPILLIALSATTAAESKTYPRCSDGIADYDAGDRQVLTPAEAASLLRLEEHDLLRAAEQGDVPGRFIAGTWRFSRTALLLWVAGNNDPAKCPDLVEIPAEDAHAVRGMGTPAEAAPATGPDGSAPDRFGEQPQAETAQKVLLRRQGVLLQQREASVELDLAHTRSDRNVLAFTRPFPTAPAVAVLADRKREVTSAGLTGRIGVTDGLELVAGLSYRWNQVEFSPNNLLLLEDSSDADFGDVGLGARYEVLTEGVHWPSLVVSADGQIPTDGSTAYALGGSISAIKSLDPTALFASIGYQHRFNEETRDPEDLEPEDTLVLSAGFAFAMNERLSIGSSVNAAFDQKTEFEGFQLESEQTYSLRLFLTTLISGGLYAEPSVSFALNGTDNIVTFGLSVPYTFAF